MLKSSFSKDPATGDLHVNLVVERALLESIGQGLVPAIIEAAAKAVADEYVRDHKMEIIANIPPRAIINAAVAKMIVNLTENSK